METLVIWPTVLHFVLFYFYIWKVIKKNIDCYFEEPISNY